jgi:hypothetical protein
MKYVLLGSSQNLFGFTCLLFPAIHWTISAYQVSRLFEPTCSVRPPTVPGLRMNSGLPRSQKTKAVFSGAH